MIIRKKIIRYACLALLILFSGLFGVTGKIEAAQLTLPNSIEEILGSTLVDEINAMEEVKKIKTDKRDENLTKYAARIMTNTSERTAGQTTFMYAVGKMVGTNGIGSILNTMQRMDEQKTKFSDSTDEDGLAVRFAPSDEEMIGTSP